MTDNSAALQRARRREGQTKRRQALAALQAMTEAGEAIGFPAVARRAGVSVSLLYADPDLLARIAGARDRQRQAGTERAARLPTRSLVTEAKWLLRVVCAPHKIQDRSLRFSRLRELAKWIGMFFDPRMRYFVFSLDDPVPALADLLAGAWRRLRRRQEA